MKEHAFDGLVDFLKKIPGIHNDIETGSDRENSWMVKFRIDPLHTLAWPVIQRLSCMNTVASANKGLPARFYPVSPVPGPNQAPDDLLHWVIEINDDTYGPGELQKWLEEKLPNPVEELAQWGLDED